MSIVSGYLLEVFPENPPSFLNDLERVTSLKYLPSDGMTMLSSLTLPYSSLFQSDDVLKARLKTVGVSEYKFEMEVAAGRDSGTEWRIVDVGGSRSQVGRLARLFHIKCSSTCLKTSAVSYPLSSSNHDGQYPITMVSSDMGTFL